jgi:hypothetical protein
MSEPAWTLTTSRSFHKGANESASLLGQLLHDWEPREFDIFDMDCVVYKRDRRCLRYFEEKLPGEQLSRAQETNLWMLSVSIEIMKSTGNLRDGGVWVVRIDSDRVDGMSRLGSPLKVARVFGDVFRQQIGDTMFGTWETFRPLFTGEEWPS